MRVIRRGTVGVTGPEERKTREEVEEVGEENAEDEKCLEDVWDVVEERVVCEAASWGEYSFVLGGHGPMPVRVGG